MHILETSGHTKPEAIIKEDQPLVFNRPRVLDPDIPPVIRFTALAYSTINKPKIIGIIIIFNVNWIPHVNDLRLKLISYQHLSLKLTYKYREVRNGISKT